MATGIMTKHIHSTARNIFSVITRRVNTKNDAIPIPKFPEAKKHQIKNTIHNKTLYLQFSLSVFVETVSFLNYVIHIFSSRFSDCKIETASR